MSFKILFFPAIRTVDINPAISNPVSSEIPSVSAAVNPIKDQSNGIAKTVGGTLLSAKSKMPKVKIVVGQGNPNVGVAG